MDHSSLFLFISGLNQTNINTILPQIHCWDLNPWPSVHEPTSITIRPRLPSLFFQIGQKLMKDNLDLTIKTSCVYQACKQKVFAYRILY